MKRVLKGKQPDINLVAYYVAYCERFGVDRQYFITYDKDIFDAKIAELKKEFCQIECITETKILYAKELL